MEKLEEHELYFIDLTRKTNAKFLPQSDFSDISESFEKVEISAFHLWKRFNRKPLNLRGYGKIKNQFFMAEIEAKDSESGKTRKFYWNFGVVGRRKVDRFNGSLHVDNLKMKLANQYNRIFDEEQRQYGEYYLDYKFGFKVKRLFLRVIVESTPAKIRMARLILGVRNAIFGRFRRE